jgi:subfamily B ATP-binding cassette protein MsbA
VIAVTPASIAVQFTPPDQEQRAQWLQQLHQHGLLRGSFRPRDSVVRLRAYLRHRAELIQHRAPHILPMQRVLQQMNLQVERVLSDIMGSTGQAIIRAIVAGEMTVGDLLRYIMFTAYLTMPIIQLASIGTQITEAFAGLDRIHEILDVAREDADAARSTEIGPIRGEVEFRDVWFEYNPGVPVMKNVSFRAPAGTTTALVGSSGSGKSTLLSLIMAFNHPKTGQILVDGRDVATLRLSDYRSQLGVVLQDNFLFDGTVAENIAYGSPSATRDDIERVSRIAHADEFIDGFEKKYDTVVGERGVRLSGGQRQRVAIARAILANPRVLLLDEATSSLDSESEALIQDGLRALRRGRTTFVIAHRLSTIQSADQILVVEGGEIVERGTHETLLTHGGRYRQLYDKQYRFEKDRFINPGEDFTDKDARDKNLTEVRS